MTDPAAAHRASRSQPAPATARRFPGAPHLLRGPATSPTMHREWAAVLASEGGTRHTGILLQAGRCHRDRWRGVPYPPGFNECSTKWNWWSHSDAMRPMANSMPEPRCALVFGYGVGLDLTRDHPKPRPKAKGLPRMGKGLRPLGAGQRLCCPVARQATLPRLHAALDINGERRQRNGAARPDLGRARYPPRAVRLYALRAGDLVVHGTPRGRGPLHPGDRFHEARLDGRRGVVRQHFVTR